MNQDDYDEDGNNIVPCPLCLNQHCPSKQDGRCPEEAMFAIEGEMRLLLGEHKATGDVSRIANVLEAVEQYVEEREVKVRDEERERIVQVIKKNSPVYQGLYSREHEYGGKRMKDILLQALTSEI